MDGAKKMRLVHELRRNAKRIEELITEAALLEMRNEEIKMILGDKNVD